MSVLVPQIKLTELSDGIAVKDITGNYSPSDNPYGYGVQTVIPAWITSAKLFIKPQSTVTASTPQGVETEIDVTGTMGAPDTAYLIHPWDFGFERIEAEKYTIRYVLAGTKPSGTTFEYKTSCEIVCVHQIQCCIDKTTAKVKNVKLDSLFKDEKSRALAEWSVLYDRAISAIGCGEYGTAEEIVAYLRSQCTCQC